MSYENFTVSIHHHGWTHTASFGKCVVSEAGITTCTDDVEYSSVWAHFKQEGPRMLLVSTSKTQSSHSTSQQRKVKTKITGCPLDTANCVPPFWYVNLLSNTCWAVCVCPLRILAYITAPDMAVRVGTCVVIRHNEHILLTRRAKTMRTFPRRWVFPGGHVDKGETLEQAAVREVKEEIGLSVCNLSLVGMWESWYIFFFVDTCLTPSFPTWLDQGMMTRQHIVFYFVADLSEEYAKDFPAWDRIKPDIHETDCVTWVHRDDLPALLSRSSPERTNLALKMKERCALVYSFFAHCGIERRD